MWILGWWIGPRKVKYSVNKCNENTNNYTATLLLNSGVEPGGWSNSGVRVDSIENKTITCTSTHLTNFAALADVSGDTQVYTVRAYHY